MKRQYIGVSAALGAAAFATADGKVGDISCTKSGNGAEILIQGTDLAKPKAARVAGSRTVVLEFSKSSGPKPGELAVNGFGVQSVKWAKQPGGIYKVYVTLDSAELDYKVVEKNGGWALELSNPAKEPSGVPTIRIHTVGDQEIIENNKVMQASNDADVPEKSAVPSSKPAEKSPAVKEPAKNLNSEVIAYAMTAPGVPVAPKAKTKSGGEKKAPESLLDGRNVSLSFSNTDVTQVLKALSLQANVNIVTSPDVKGNVSVGLERVSVREALEYVTAVANLRFGQVRNTILVSTAGKYEDLMKQFTGALAEPTTSRVVPIFSGKGNQIKATLFKSLPIETTAGMYDILLASEDTTIKRNQTLGDSDKLAAAAASAVGKDAAPSESASIESKVQNDKTGGPAANDTYVVIVGQRNRLDEVEAEVRRVDREICAATLVPVPEERVATSTLFRCTTVAAKSLLASICEPSKTKELATQPNRTQIGGVLLFANDAPSGSDQVIVLNGPRHEVDQLIQILTQLDAQSALSTSVSIYDVMYRDPRSLKDDLSVQIPGLRVTVAPNTAAAPQLYQSGQNKNDAKSQGLGSQSPSSGGASGGASGGSSSSGGDNGSAGGSSSASGVVAGGQANVNGIELPYANLENAAVPMRLVLRGSDAQIRQAQEYLRLVDTAPKMVALEVRVMELTKSDSLKAGLDWNLFTGGAVKFLRLNNSQASASNSAGVSVNSGGVSGDVISQLDKIATKTNLIARPNVLATDGRQTEIFVGDAIRYVESIISSQNGVTVTTGTVRVGVRVSVMPRIGGNESITMDLRPVVSFLRGFTEIKQIQGQLPQTSERMSQQTINIKSGETIAIGGLIQDQDRQDVSGVPILMDLPIIGNLFKKQTLTKDRTEMVIFISAKAIDGPVGSNSEFLPIQLTKDRVDHDKGFDKGKKNGGSK